MKSTNRMARERMAVLGDASRFRIAQALAGAEGCVTELADRVGLSQSCTTRHLQAMARAGLVSGLRDGKRVVFRLRTDDPSIGALLRWALAAEAAPWPAPGPRPRRRPLRRAPGAGGPGPAAAVAEARPAAPAAPIVETDTALDPVFDAPAMASDGPAEEPIRPGRPGRSNDLEDFLL